MILSRAYNMMITSLLAIDRISSAAVVLLGSVVTSGCTFPARSRRAPLSTAFMLLAISHVRADSSQGSPVINGVSNGVLQSDVAAGCPGGSTSSGYYRCGTPGAANTDTNMKLRLSVTCASGSMLAVAARFKHDEQTSTGTFPDGSASAFHLEHGGLAEYLGFDGGGAATGMLPAVEHYSVLDTSGRRPLCSYRF
jgi:hypothetical protein